MVAAPKSASAHGAKAQKFTIDFSKPANDKIFDGAAFEKFLHDRIKVDGRTGQLGEKIKIAREGETKIVITANIAFSKRYLKMLTKKYLKKNSLREWLRVVATNKNTYTLKYFQTPPEDDAEDAWIARFKSQKFKKLHVKRPLQLDRPKTVHIGW